jgi:Ni/Co efflux regulator RcnB
MIGIYAEQYVYSHTVYDTYHLTGPKALTHWIKAEVQIILAQAGFHFIEVAISD